MVTVESLPSGMEGQSALSARTESIASADKLVSPHYFEDAMLVTPFCGPTYKLQPRRGIINGTIHDVAEDDIGKFHFDCLISYG
jgi:hypothetical protein